MSRFDPTRSPPTWLHLTTATSRLCNYRCRHCHIWMQKDSQNELTVEQRVDLIRQFAAFGPDGTVAIPGGEVMMDLDELLVLTGACRESRLECILNANGSYITDEKIARTVVESGITRLCISLDSHVPELHNYTRGVASAYRETLRAIRLLVEARDRWNPRFFLSVSCVVFDRNLELLRDFVEFCRGLGVDRADFQLLSQTFANAHPTRDVFFEEHFFHTPEAKARAIGVLTGVIDDYRTDGFLQKTREDLPSMIGYLSSQEFLTDEPICGSHERNLIVHPNGDVALCHNSYGVMPEDEYVGNVRHESLREIWTGARAQRARAIMDQCRLGCGSLNCHRR